MRCAVKGDRRFGSVSADQVDHGFKELQLFLGRPNPATDNDAVPRPGLKRGGDPSLDVVAAVETYQAGVCIEAVVGKSCHTDRDRVRDRLWVPWAGHPIRIETDDENVKLRNHVTHRRGKLRSV